MCSRTRSAAVWGWQHTGQRLVREGHVSEENTMRKLIVTMWVTLDGYIAGPNGEMDWVTSGYDKDMGQYEDGIVSAADTLLLGRVTYESFAGSWPNVPDNPDVSE